MVIKVQNLFASTETVQNIAHNLYLLVDHVAKCGRFLFPQNRTQKVFLQKLFYYIVMDHKMNLQVTSFIKIVEMVLQKLFG